MIEMNMSGENTKIEIQIVGIVVAAVVAVDGLFPSLSVIFNSFGSISLTIQLIHSLVDTATVQALLVVGDMWNCECVCVCVSPTIWPRTSHTSHPYFAQIQINSINRLPENGFCCCRCCCDDARHIETSLYSVISENFTTIRRRRKRLHLARITRSGKDDRRNDT